MLVVQASPAHSVPRESENRGTYFVDGRLNSRTEQALQLALTARVGSLRLHSFSLWLHKILWISVLSLLGICSTYVAPTRR